VGTRRPVYGEDFEGTAPLIRDARRVNRWGVCVEGYELRAPRRGMPHSHWLCAKRPLQLTDADSEYWKTYKPLEDHPDLFLKFARLSRQPTSPQRALDWCGQYGVLGLAGDYVSGWTGENRAHRGYETLEAFDAELHRAAGVLALYEAVLNRDYEAAEHYASEKYPEISAELRAIGIRRKWNPSLIQEMVQTHGGGDYLAYALQAASWIVEATIRESCYPTLRSEKSTNPSNVTGSWGFKNLRGAMYLQMYWLMAAGGNVRHCKYCGGVMALSPSLPGTRKPRQDKQFCDDACRQRHHYHKTKLARQSAHS
jgi:hypothetical protein